MKRRGVFRSFYLFDWGCFIEWICVVQVDAGFLFFFFFFFLRPFDAFDFYGHTFFIVQGSYSGLSRTVSSIL